MHFCWILAHWQVLSMSQLLQCTCRPVRFGTSGSREKVITNRRERGKNLAMLNSHIRKGRAHLPKVGTKNRKKEPCNDKYTGAHERRGGGGNMTLRKIPTALWTLPGFLLRDPA